MDWVNHWLVSRQVIAVMIPYLERVHLPFVEMIAVNCRWLLTAAQLMALVDSQEAATVFVHLSYFIHNEISLHLKHCGSSFSFNLLKAYIYSRFHALLP